MTEASAVHKKSLLIVFRALLCALLAVFVLNAATHLDFRHPFIGYGFGGAFLLHLAAERSPKRLALLLVTSALLTSRVVWGSYHGLATLVAEVVGACGLASLFLMTAFVLWRGRRREPATYQALAPSVVLAFFVLGTQSVLNVATFFHRETLDLYAYRFDATLGLQPSFVLGRFAYSHDWLLPLAKISYEGIPLAIAALYAGFMRRRRTLLWEIIVALAVSTIVGYIFFAVFPVCGPRFAFEHDFPRRAPRVELERLGPFSLPLEFPRNAVPSLHLTWALLIWLNSRGLRRRAQWAAFALVVATGFDTLASGEHYLFDLVAALPFTLCMQASVVRMVSSGARQLWKPIAFGGVLFVAYLVAGRWGLSSLRANPVLSWGLVAVTALISIGWGLRLPPLMPEMGIAHGEARGR